MFLLRASFDDGVSIIIGSMLLILMILTILILSN